MRGEINDMNDILLYIKKESKTERGLKQSKSDFRMRVNKEKVKCRNKPNRGKMQLKSKTHVIDHDLKKWVTSSAKNIFSKHPSEPIEMFVDNSLKSVSLNKRNVNCNQNYDAYTLESGSRNSYRNSNQNDKQREFMYKELVIDQNETRSQLKIPLIKQNNNPLKHNICNDYKSYALSNEYRGLKHNHFKLLSIPIKKSINVPLFKKDFCFDKLNKEFKLRVLCKKNQLKLTKYKPVFPE